MNEEVEDAFRTENENVHYQKGCYCGENKESEILRCMSCHRCLHSDCLKTGLPTPLEGDIYFDVTCSECASDGEEMCKRAYMSWTQAVYLALYNLSICTSGRKGYFRWKEDICQFLERNWMLLFPGRKRTTSWCSTVAGTLSIGCPQYFKSGLKQFKENGWWALADKVPPVVKLGNPGSEQKRKKNSNKSSKKRKTQVESLPMREQNTKEEKEDKKKIDPSYEEHDDQLLESLLSGDAVTMDTESDEVIASLLAQEEEQSLEVSAKSLFPFMEVDDPCTLISDAIKDEWNGSQDDSHISEGNNDSGNESDRAESLASTIKSEVKKPSKMKQSNEQDIAAESIRNRLIKISEDDEHEVLCRLNACTEAIQKDCKARRLKRKLILRKIKRENGLPLFDLDAFINKSLSSTKCYVFKDGDFVSSKKDELMYDTAEKKKEQEGYQQRKSNIFTRYSRVLDRFLAAPQMLRRRDQQVPTFLSRLVGADRQTLLRPITSPYTARVLKPFIRRDFESRPLKLRLLEEIENYPHRNDPSWKAPPPSYSIDYCYVQPYHIPAVNTMCREFFWPGIDLSESLQYPDFSCVVLFRSLVIGFAFMVPDVKYNEAYISFILVHPEWRRAGIGTYMLYHLIQTCMGKDVTLHVSVTNQAMLMYQKFGFKPEEFILDFYEKYLPENSLECRHAFFLRLRR